MKMLTAGVLAAATVLSAAPGRAQLPHLTPFSFEARAGVAVPTGSFNRLANPGYALNGNVTANFLPQVGVYGGYNYLRFPHQGGGHYNETGPEVGLRFDIPTPMIPIDPYVKAGVAFHRLKLTGSGAATDFSNSGMGIQVNGGAAFRFGLVSLTPGVTFVSYGYNDGTTDRTASYVKADIGVRVRI